MDWVFSRSQRTASWEKPGSITVDDGISTQHQVTDCAPPTSPVTALKGIWFANHGFVRQISYRYQSTDLEMDDCLVIALKICIISRSAKRAIKGVFIPLYVSSYWSICIYRLRLLDLPINWSWTYLYNRCLSRFPCTRREMYSINLRNRGKISLRQNFTLARHNPAFWKNWLEGRVILVCRCR
jgi:hypothetical protein